MFRLFDHNMDGIYDYGDLQAFFKFCWLFQNYDANGDNEVDDIEIMEGNKAMRSIIPLNGMER